MLRQIGVLALIALMSYHTSAHSLDSRLYARSWILPKNSSKSLVQGTLFATDANTFPYAVCEFTKPNVEQMCNVTLVTPMKQDLNCTEVKVFAGDDDKELFLGGYFQLIPFKDNHVIVAWWDHQIKESPIAPEENSGFKISILEMTTCEYANLDFTIDKVAVDFFPALTIYSEQIDVVLNSKKSCGDAGRCILSFDLEGKQIGEAKPYLPHLSQYASAASAASPDKGFFQYAKNLSSISVLYVNSEGEGTEVMSAKFEEQKKIAKRDAYSNAHELYSICWTPSISTKKPTTVNCSQFDATGNQKLSKVITFPQLLNWVAVRNLPKGGLILAAGGCDKRGLPGNDCKKFQIYKIDEFGKQSKRYVVEAPDHKCYDITTDLEVRISENDLNEFCFDFSCLSSASNLRFTSKCVPKEDMPN